MSTARSSTFFATRGLAGISHSRQLKGETKLHLREPARVEKSDLKQKLAEREVVAQTQLEVATKEEEEKVEVPPQEHVKSEQAPEPGLEAYYFPEDADDGIVLAAKEEEEEESEDEEEMLLRELARIKEERAIAEARKKAEEDVRNLRIKEEEAVNANPLMGSSASLLKRQWFQDTVFSNTTTSQPRAKKAHVNDPIRNEFHKKFLNKYIG